jgi:DNA-binding beta-propeller fold protein YncE
LYIVALAPSSVRRRYAALAGVLALVAVGLFIAAGDSPPGPVIVRVDGGPSAIAVSDERVWVASPRTGSIAVIDALTGAQSLPALRVGGTPARLALGATGLWVADAADGAVVPVQTRPPRVLAPIRVGPDASDIVLSGRALWVASSADSRVYVLDAAGAGALRVGRGPVALAADGRRVVVADGQAGTLTVIDAPTRRITGAPVKIGGAPVDVALAGDVAWVADSSGGRVISVNLRSGAVGDPIAVGRRPVALAVAGADVYVVGNRSLLRIRDGKVRSRRDLKADPTALAVDNRFVWVTAGDAVLRYDR